MDMSGQKWYQAQFLKKLKAFGLYLVKFCDNSFIKEKVYPLDCAVNGFNKRPVIFITHDKSTFLVNYD